MAYVWRYGNGKCFHIGPPKDCPQSTSARESTSNKTTLQAALSLGMKPCRHCNPSVNPTSYLPSQKTSTPLPSAPLKISLSQILQDSIPSTKPTIPMPLLNFGSSDLAPFIGQQPAPVSTNPSVTSVPLVPVPLPTKPMQQQAQQSTLVASIPVQVQGPPKPTTWGPFPPQPVKQPVLDFGSIPTVLQQPTTQVVPPPPRPLPVKPFALSSQLPGPSTTTTICPSSSQQTPPKAPHVPERYEITPRKAKSPLIAKRVVGRAIVIGNSQYADSPLLGVTKDLPKMKRTLEKMDFEVAVKENLTAREMREAIIQEAKECEPTDLFVIYFSGHGNTGVMHGVDGKECDIAHLQGTIELDVHRLEKRPKIFILDCCQGKERYRSRAPAPEVRESQHSDWLFWYPTKSGYVSVENFAYGGLFTAKLTQVLSQGHTGESLPDIFTTVVRELQAENQQKPWQLSTLQRKLMF